MAETGTDCAALAETAVFLFKDMPDHRQCGGLGSGRRTHSLLVARVN
jgi:hypothetical protein